MNGSEEVPETSPCASVSVGAASTVVSPPAGTHLSGFIARTGPMTGVHDDLYARALVWDDGSGPGGTAALLTLDVIDLDASSVATIRERAGRLTGIPADQIGVACTHTHGGPATLSGRSLGKVDPGFVDRLCHLAAATVGAAARRREPMLLRWALGTESTVGKNRRVPGGPIDPDVPVIRFQRPDGTVGALLTGYACHPVTLGPDNVMATADYPGHVVATLEATYPGATALFATGCCGQINTGHTARDSHRPGGSPWRTHGEARRLGRAVAGAAIQAAEQASRDDVAAATRATPIVPAAVRTARRSIRLPMLPPDDPATVATLVAAWAEERQRIGTGGHPGEAARLDVFTGWAAALGAGNLPETVEAEVMVIALGDVSIVLLPGEMFVEFGLAIKASLAPRSVMSIGYANGTPGYIPHWSAYAEGGYEVTEAYRYYGYPACFAPEAGEGLVEAAVDLVMTLADTAPNRDAGVGRNRSEVSA